VKYVGLDWAYRTAQWCALAPSGEIAGEGRIAADRDGLARLVFELGDEVTACLEMMSGALWVRDQLVACGWQVQVADARKVKTVAPLAAKTDKVDARLLAELSRRQLVPALWLPSLDERALRERLRRRMHLVRLRTSAKGRIFGLQTQWGVRVSLARLRRADGLTLLEGAGMPAVWRRSVSECLALIDFLDARLEPLDQELRPFAKADPRAVLLDTIPGIAELLALTIAVEIGDISRFATPEKLVSYGRLAPRVRQSGQGQPRSGPLSKSGSRLLGWAAVEAAQQAWRETNPWHELYLDVSGRSRNHNAAKAAVARKILIAAWHVLSRQQPFKPAARRRPTPASASSRCFLAARRPRMELRSRDSSHEHSAQPRAPKEK
jgi:transposase